MKSSLGDEQQQPAAKKPLSLPNLGIGAAMQVFEVSTLGQPFEVIKTHMAAHRSDTLLTAIRKTWQRGGLAGFYQGLIPWAWIEACSKGGILLFSSSEIEYQAKRNLGLGAPTAAILGGMGGGICQAFTTMGFCTFMKTVEVTRHKQAGVQAASTWSVAREVLQREGLRGLNKGVSAVAIRQMTNWGSRFGISRFTESLFKSKDDSPLSLSQKLMASVVGGTLACWNQPIEVIRVEMQSQAKNPDRPAKLNIWTAAKYIYGKNGFRGFYRGVTPRIGLGIYLTVCMVFGGDQLKERFGTK